jgi:hypothetical protein
MNPHKMRRIEPRFKGSQGFANQMAPAADVNCGVLILRFNPFDFADVDDEMSTVGDDHESLSEMRLRIT